MSLSALNSPPLVALAGITSIASLPSFEKLVLEGTISWSAIKALNALSYAVNTISVSVPGRIDGELADELVDEKAGKKGGKTSKEAESMSSLKGRSLVTPSGWAFAIWGPIYAGEMVFVASQFLLDESSPVSGIIKKLSPAFITTQTLQSLWCAAFRPKYKGRLMYISSGLLAAAAHSLSKAHATYTPSPTSSYSPAQYWMYFLPTTLHFGWLTAATFVNLNGAVASMESLSSKTVALIGHASVIAASAAGVSVTLMRSAPVFGGVISWALWAVADGMKKRLREAEKEDVEVRGTYGAARQEKICKVGAVLCLCSSFFVAFLRQS